jgi:hypothetical protein
VAKEDEHPVRAEDVFARAPEDFTPPVRDHMILLRCETCGAEQTLRNCSIELADDPNDITACRCMRGCQVVLVTGFPTPIPLPDSGRYRMGDYCIQAGPSRWRVRSTDLTGYGRSLIPPTQLPPPLPRQRGARLTRDEPTASPRHRQGRGGLAATWRSRTLSRSPGAVR